MGVSLEGIWNWTERRFELSRALPFAKGTSPHEVCGISFSTRDISLFLMREDGSSLDRIASRTLQTYDAIQ